MSTLPRLQLSDLQSTSEGLPIAQGGRGTIYPTKLRRMLSPELVQTGRYLLKRPRVPASQINPQDISRHLDQIRRRLTFEANYFKSRLALPIGIVERGHTFIGYLMPEFTDGCLYTKQFSSGDKKPALQELKVFLNSESERRILGVPSISTSQRVQIVADAFDTLAKLHEKGLVVGDFSGSNLVLQNKPTKKSTLRVVFLDVDSFSYKNGSHPLGHESTLHWRSPEELDSSLVKPNKSTDVYKAALLVRRLFHQEINTGISSYDIYRSKVSNAALIELGGPSLSNLVAKALDPKPEARPKSMELAFHFRELANSLIEKG
jgi:serine/threonine protein kinase